LLKRAAHEAALSILKVLRIGGGWHSRLYTRLMVAAWAVNVAVGQFFIGRSADIANGHVKMEGHTGQRMVAIDFYRLFFDPNHAEQFDTVRAASLETHAGFDFCNVLEHRFGQVDDFGFVMNAIAILRGEHHVERIALALAFELFLKLGKQIAIALEIGQRGSWIGFVDDLTVFIRESVVDHDDFIFSDVHKYSR